MSAPDTNVDKQKKRHKPALLGIRGVVIFALVLLLGLVGWIALRADGPEGADTQIDGRTGEIEATE